MESSSEGDDVSNLEFVSIREVRNANEPSTSAPAAKATPPRSSLSASSLRRSFGDSHTFTGGAAHAPAQGRRSSDWLRHSGSGPAAPGNSWATPAGHSSQEAPVDRRRSSLGEEVSLEDGERRQFGGADGGIEDVGTAAAAAAASAGGDSDGSADIGAGEADAETTSAVEISTLRQMIVKIVRARSARKLEMKEFRRQQKNNEVVVKEFGMSLHNLRADVLPLREEVAKLRAAYEAAAAELEAREARVTALEEVLHDKAIDSDSCRTSLTELRADDAEDAARERELRFMLDHKEFPELSRCTRAYMAACASGTNILTTSMAIHNQIEKRMREQAIPAVPDGLRGAVWQALSPLSILKQRESGGSGDLYYKLLEQFSGFETSIDKDILRTFPNEEFRQILLVNDNTVALSNVLKAYSCWDTALGYCQGMNFIVGMLLCYMRQEEAFWMLVVILTHHKMIGLFQAQCPLLPHFLNAFEHELRIQLPRLSAHFRAEGVSAVMYVTEWFTTMFVYSLPRETCAAVWDCFFFGGGPLALFRCSVALLRLLEPDLLGLPMEDIVIFLKKRTKHVSVEALMRMQRQVYLTRATERLLQERLSVKWIEDRGIRTLTCMVQEENILRRDSH